MHRTAAPPVEPEVILAFEPFGLGDAVCALPTLRLLKERFGDAELHFVTGPLGAALAEGLPFIDVVERCPAAFGEMRSFLKCHRGRPRTLAVLLNDGWWPNVTALRLGAAWHCGYLYRPRRDARYHPDRLSSATWDREVRIDVPSQTHLVWRAAKAAQPALGELNEADLRRPVPELADASFLESVELPRAWCEASTAERVLLHPGAGSSLKRWPARKWHDLASLLVDEGRVVCIDGSADERAEAEAILEGIPPARAFNFCGLVGIGAIGALAASCALAVSTDSGVAHVASAVGCPVAVLMGATSAETSGPFWGRAEVVADQALPVPARLDRVDGEAAAAARENMARVRVGAVLEAVGRLKHA